jgi:hypothetical protein
MFRVHRSRKVTIGNFYLHSLVVVCSIVHTFVLSDIVVCLRDTSDIQTVVTPRSSCKTVGSAEEIALRDPKKSSVTSLFQSANRGIMKVSY